MLETAEPYTGVALIAALAQLQAKTTAYLAALPSAAFFAPQGPAWAPAAHVRHLTWSVRLVGQGLRLPRVVLRMAFGRSEGRSRDFAAVRTAYLATLARGAQAPFTPSPKPPLADLAAGRAQLLTRLDGAADYLITGISRWDEVGLDRYRLPHPLLGRLTIREMLCFTVYHNTHHVRRIAERAGAVEIASRGA
jgi:hypothetical protein